MDQPMLPRLGLTALDIRQALRRRYRAQDPYQWVLIDELALSTGAADRRIDVFALNCYNSGAYHSIAFEIKVSRGDYLSEIKKPQKRRGALLLSNQFFFVAPVGLIRPDEIPGECGLMEVDTDLQCRIKVQAPYHDRLPATWAFMAVVLRTVINRQGRGNG